MRAAPHLVMKRPPIGGYADRLAVLGFDDKQTLMTLASVWNAELTNIQPDAIIGIGTPVLWLVGRAHAPTFAVGNGCMLAPPLGNSFPRLTPNSTPLADDNAMLANANAVLSRMGQPSLATLGELSSDCQPMLYGLSALDPYLQLRSGRTTGLLGTAPNPSPLPERERLVMSLYYDDELNLKEIGAALRVSESRICQIHGQALVRLQARLAGWRDRL